ncbi:MAG: BamA/TamA family outer membrane protein, partial [Bacteroidota bacterium]
TLQKSLGRIAASNGFPFAQVKLDSIAWQGAAQLSAKISINKGELLFFEQIKLQGDLAISINYLEQYLGLIPGHPYNEELIQRVPQRLQELPFLQLKQAPKVEFIGNQARLILDLVPKKASRLDLIVGVLPNSAQTGRLLVTGQLDGTLQNPFGKGENISIELEQLRAQSPELLLTFQYPYLLQLPFGLDTRLEVYRRDTNFINVSWQLGIDYLLSGGRSVQAFWAQQQTNLLSIDSAKLAQNPLLPDTLDVRRTAFGLGFQLSQLDYRNNPRKGWSWTFSGSAGQKNVRPNSSIQEFGFGELYDSLELRSAQYRLETTAAWYRPFGQRSVLKVGINAAAIIANEPVLANEQFRIGGNRMLRGFDEESIFATNFVLLSGEYRFLLATNSYLYTFFDWSRVDNSSLNSTPGINTQVWYQGFGAGITFETRPGLFGLSLAFGRQDQQAFDLGAPKVHFGFVSLF